MSQGRDGCSRIRRDFQYARLAGRDLGGDPRVAADYGAVLAEIGDLCRGVTAA